MPDENSLPNRPAANLPRATARAAKGLADGELQDVRERGGLTSTTLFS